MSAYRGCIPARFEDAAEKAKQEGDEGIGNDPAQSIMQGSNGAGGAEFQMMLAGEISEKIEAILFLFMICQCLSPFTKELESKHGSAPPLPGLSRESVSTFAMTYTLRSLTHAPLSSKPVLFFRRSRRKQ